MRVFLFALLVFVMSSPAVSQTFVRGDSKLVYESNDFNISEIKITQNVSLLDGSQVEVCCDSTYIKWSWEFVASVPSGVWPNRGFKRETVKVNFRIGDLGSSIFLMQECIRILDMEVTLGSHDKIVHEIMDVQIVRAGNKADPLYSEGSDVVYLYPMREMNPLTGEPSYWSKPLALTKSMCQLLVQKLQNHTPLLGN